MVLKRIFFRFVGTIFLPRRTFRVITKERVSPLEGPVVSSVVFMGFVVVVYFVKGSISIYTALYLFCLLHGIWFVFTYFMHRIFMYAYGISRNFAEFYGVVSYSLPSSTIIYLSALAIKFLKISTLVVIVSTTILLLSVWLLWLLCLIYIATHIYYDVQPTQFLTTLLMVLMTLLFVGAYIYIAFNEFFKPLIEMVKIESAKFSRLP